MFKSVLDNVLNPGSLIPYCCSSAVETVVAVSLSVK